MAGDQPSVSDRAPEPSTKERQKRPLPAIERDVTSTSTFKDLWRRREEYLQPSKDVPVDFENIAFSPDGKYVAGAATVCKELKGLPPTRLAIFNREDSKLSTFGERQGSDSKPQWSPDGKVVAFLSEEKGANQLHLLKFDSGDIIAAGKIPGSIDQLSWSQDGTRILLIVAGPGSDLAGYQGGRPLFTDSEAAPEKWMPSIETTQAADAYRTAWLYEVSSGSLRQATPATLNIWEAVWISSDSIIGLCSDLPGEEDWYHSTLREISLETRFVKELFATDISMEWLAASPSGKRIAFAVGVASDRLILMGDLYILEVASGRATPIDTLRVNVGAITWADDEDVVAAGIRDGRDVIIQYNLEANQVRELWSSEELSVGMSHVLEVSAFKGHEVQAALVCSGYFSPPTLVITSSSGVQDTKAFSSPELREKLQGVGQATTFRWKAPDGLDIYGYLLCPSTAGPHPTIMNIHGGPVWGWRPRYIGKFVQMQALLDAGFAIFEPNPRGSWGRGQSFSRAVFGDMGGLDTQDYLSGLDALVDAGLADPNRLGVTGGSYGGFMSAWLISQSDRFAAAFSISPVTDWVSQHFTCNIGRFCRDFLGDDVHNPTGHYFSRSPIHHVRKVKTPTLLTCGVLDQNTPAGQAVEFHRALVEQGTTSVLVTYPEEGHGVKNFPAAVDMVTRQIEWFKAFLM